MDFRYQEQGSRGSSGDAASQGASTKESLKSGDPERENPGKWDIRGTGMGIRVTWG